MFFNILDLLANYPYLASLMAMIHAEHSDSVDAFNS